MTELREQFAQWLAEHPEKNLCRHCGERIERSGGAYYPWTHSDGNQQKCYRAEPKPVVELEPACDSCGAPSTHQMRIRDVTATDRGDWVQEGSEWACDDCDPNWRGWQ